jgi:hypothetical protein
MYHAKKWHFSYINMCLEKKTLHDFFIKGTARKQYTNASMDAHSQKKKKKLRKKNPATLFRYL